MCTGNICRSPLAERLGRAYLDEALGSTAPAIQVSSAGTGAVVDSAMDHRSALVLQSLGGDPGGFRARQLSADMATGADLVLAMTRGHRLAVLDVAPGALSRTFTLREAADIVELLGEELDLPGTGPADRARALVRRMAGARSRRGSSEADDVPDPIGLAVEFHEQVGDVIAQTLLPVLARLAEGFRTEPGRRG